MGIEEQIDRLIDLGEEIRDSLNHLKVVRLRDALRAAGPKVFDAVADEPAKEPPEPEYREPVLPADAGKECEVSDDGKTWVGGKVYGWRVAPDSWWAWGRWHRFARIKKDA